MGVDKVPGKWSGQYENQFEVNRQVQSALDIRQRERKELGRGGEPIKLQLNEKVFEKEQDRHQAFVKKTLAVKDSDGLSLKSLITKSAALMTKEVNAAGDDEEKKSAAKARHTLFEAHIHDALASRAECTALKERYTHAVTQFNKEIKEEQTDIFYLIKAFTSIRNDVIEEQKQEGEQVVNKITALFSEQGNPFLTRLEALEIEPDLESLKENLVKSTQENYTKQSADIKDPTEKDLEAAHKEAANQMNRLIYWENQRKYNSYMAQQINEMAEEKLADSQAGVAAVTNFGSKPLSLNDFDETKVNLVTLSAKSISAIGDTLTLGSKKGWARLYPSFLDPRCTVDADLESLAQAMKAKQAKENKADDPITMVVKVADQKKASQLAMKAVKAAMLKAGYPEDKTFVEVNGVVKKPEEVFKDKPEELASIRKQAAEVKKEMDKKTAATDQPTVDTIKKRLLGMTPPPQTTVKTVQSHTPARSPTP